ncbi:mersacidin/lichenicidin family type 2 lantibiotic [Iningainema tapete]|uniref:Mersacidin/lichenicidin family type 2 lantibiotic n=1 Tax=Iningainema tapete BLCC-T55 TaxID=2748662 RepID=A0A8J6Y277_9CYAN|nr:mersacidin/lichenicidin family type 2 lantibiotic [Iningainema tapete]MBD2778093.1 mersacidin/lichenicidin family type 2 lantibiotic [Iningainema tapete BLCC-T55]
MSTEEIVRAWKDKNYRNSLSDQQKAMLPSNPAGLIDLTDDDMMSLSGGCTMCGNPNHTLVWYECLE